MKMIQYTSNKELNITLSADFKKYNEDTSFLTYLYFETEAHHKIYFEFYRNKQIISTFILDANFFGYQCVLVPFKDMHIFSKSNATSLKVRFSKNENVIYKMAEPKIIEFDRRYPTPDYVLPFVNVETNHSINKNWTALLMYDEILKQYELSIDKSPIENLEDIIQKLNQIDDRIYKSFNFQYTEDQVKNIHKDLISKKLHLWVFSKEDIELKQYGRFMLYLSKNLDKYSKEYISLYEYIIKEGFRRGSNFTTTDHLGYQTKEIFTSIFNARNILKENGYLESAIGICSWFNGLGRIINNNVQEVNIDVLNTQLKGMLYSILLINNKSLMKQFSVWLSNNILASKGLLGGFKKDYSMFHHCQHYVAYGVDALESLLPIVYVLENTNYSINKKAKDKLLNVVKRLRIYTQDKYIPICLSGRHPDESYSVKTYIYNYLKEDTSPKEENYLFSMNYAGMLVKRTKKGTIFLARGFSRYLVGNESYTNKNIYGRYSLYGRYEIVPSDLSKKDYNYNTFDFSHFPGTTTFKKNKKELTSILNHLKAAGVEEMLLSTEKFLASNTLENVGIFGLKVHGHRKYGEEKLRANKSIFILNDTVVCLGSNIYPLAITTIFQSIQPKKYIDDYTVKINDTTYYLDKSYKYITDKNSLYIEHKDNNKYRYELTLDNSEKEKYEVLKHEGYEHIIKYKEYTLYVLFSNQVSIPEGLLLKSVSKKTVIIVKEEKDKVILSIINPDLRLYEDVELDQLDNNIQKEVSIYSRSWIGNDPRSESILISFDNSYELVSSEYAKTISDKTKPNYLNVLIEAVGYEERVIILNKK